MKEYNKDGIKFNYKKNLTEEDFITLIKSYIEIFNNGLDGEIDNIVGLHKNPILAERSFNMNLGNLCIENFDAELHTKLFNNGIYNFLKEDIINVKEAHNLAKEICQRVDSVDELVYQFLNKIIDLIPSELDIKKLQDSWGKVSSEYAKITSKTE
jgi:hypothetical protein